MDALIGEGRLSDANNEVVIKSVYDPSPVRYSLPASNAFTGFTTTGGYTNNSSEFNVQGVFNKGWYFYCKPDKQGSTMFFPASGFRYYYAGSLDGVTACGFCCVAGPHDRSNGRFLDLYSGSVYPLSNAYRSYGYSVRSAEEKMFLMCIGGL